MRHARPDYNCIQAPESMIPADEPVFLLRGQDPLAPGLLRAWVTNGLAIGVDHAMLELVERHADSMLEWQKTHCKVPGL